MKISKCNKRKWKKRKKFFNFFIYYFFWTGADVSCTPTRPLGWLMDAYAPGARTRGLQAQDRHKLGITLWDMYQEGRWRYRRACVQCACARITQLASRTRTRQERARAGGFVPQAWCWRSVGTTLGSMYGGMKFCNPRVRVHGARAWMVENTWCTRTRTVRIRVDGALFFKKNFYVFAPIQAFQTSKQLPKHHKSLLTY